MFKSKFQAKLKVINAFKSNQSDAECGAEKVPQEEDENFLDKIGLETLGDAFESGAKNFQGELEKLGKTVQIFESKVESFEKLFCYRLYQCYNGLPEFEDGELFKMMDTMWRQRWLPQIFMRNIGAFNFDGPLTVAARQFKKKFEHED